MLDLNVHFWLLHSLLLDLSVHIWRSHCILLDLNASKNLGSWKCWISSHSKNQPSWLSLNQTSKLDSHPGCHSIKPVSESWRPTGRLKGGSGGGAQTPQEEPTAATRGQLFYLARPLTHSVQGWNILCGGSLTSTSAAGELPAHEISAAPVAWSALRMTRHPPDFPILGLSIKLIGKPIPSLSHLTISSVHGPESF